MNNYCMLREWKRRVAMRWLKEFLAGELDDNTTGASSRGRDPKYPGVWFNFSATTEREPHDSRR